MYVIVVYDVNSKRVAKLCKYLRQHLTWVQNSVFEGYLTEAQFARVRAGIRKHIDANEDAVLYYVFASDKWVERGVIGVEKNPIDNIL